MTQVISTHLGESLGTDFFSVREQFAALARGWGCRGVDVETTEELEQEFKTALNADTTTVIVVRTQPQEAML